jgi:hypothetical protein
MMGAMRALAIVLFLTATAQANAPAPWAMCMGKNAGDSCNSMYYPLGKCVRDDMSCREHPQCLTCRSRSGCDIGAGGAATGAALVGAALLALLLRRRPQ